MWRRVGCIALIVVAIALIGGIIYQQTQGEGGGFSSLFKKDSDEEKESNFEAARVDSLKLTVAATGNTEPITDIEVKSEATGRITEFYVDEGDVVTRGDLICKLDQSNQLLVVQARQIATEQALLGYQEAKSASSKTQRTALETALSSAQANLDSAQEAFVNAEATYARIEELHGKGYATDAELDNARQALAAARAGLDTAESGVANAQTQLEAFEESSDENTIEQARLTYEGAEVALAEAKKQLGDSVIASPIDGIILEKPLDVGDSVVSINSAYGGGNTIVRVADMSRIQVRTSVDEIDIGKIEIGQPAVVTVDAFPEREFEGNVTNVFPQGVTTGTGLISFIALVEVDNQDGLLLGNMTADVEIEAQVLEDVLLVPLAATRAGEKPDTDIVYVLKEGEDQYDDKAETEEREVKLGDTDYYDIVVLEGLEEGEMVKVRGFASAIRLGG